MRKGTLVVLVVVVLIVAAALALRGQGAEVLSDLFYSMHGGRGH